MRIDVRNRPPTAEFEQSFNSRLLSFVAGRMKVPFPAHYASHSLEDWRQELVDAEFDRVVVVGRNTRSVSIPNEHIAALQERYKGFVLGAAGIDVSSTVHHPVEELRRCAKGLGIHVAALDPGSGEMYPDDQAIYPFYEAASELEIPLVMMAGPFAGKDFSYGRPESIDRVAADFPDLRIIVGHGAYPYVTDAICLAFKHPNVYLAPDCYIFLPGGNLYVEAANTILGDQVLFGTAYPFGDDLATVLSKTEALGLSDEVLPRYMGSNAQQVLGKALEAVG